MSEQITITVTPGQSLSLRHDVYSSYWVAYQVESCRDDGEAIDILLVNPENADDTAILRFAKPVGHVTKPHDIAS